MDFENKNEAFDVSSEEVSETEKAIDSFLNGSVYTEEDAKKDAEASKFINGKETVLCALSVFALALWNISGYGAIILSALALVMVVYTGACKNAVRVCVSNSLTLAVIAVIRVAISIISVVVQTFYVYALEKSVTTKFSNLISLSTNITGILVFVFFVVNALYLMSKSHTFLFSKTAQAFADRED